MIVPRYRLRTEPPRRLTSLQSTENNVFLLWELSNLIDLCYDAVYRRHELPLLIFYVLRPPINKSPKSLERFHVFVVPQRVLLLNLLATLCIHVVDLLPDLLANAACTLDIALFTLLHDLTSLTPGLVPPCFVLRPVLSDLSLQSFSGFYQIFSVALSHLLAL